MIQNQAKPGPVFKIGQIPYHDLDQLNTGAGMCNKA